VFTFIQLLVLAEDALFTSLRRAAVAARLGARGLTRGFVRVWEGLRPAIALEGAVRSGLLEVLCASLAVAVCVGGCCCLPEGPFVEPNPADMVGKYAGKYVVTRTGSRLAHAAGVSYDPPGPQMLELKTDGTCVVENLYVGDTPSRFLSREGTWQLHWDKARTVGCVALVFDGDGGRDLEVLGYFKPYVLVDRILGPDLSDGFVYSKQRQ